MGASDFVGTGVPPPPTPQGAVAQEGLEALSYNQVVEFRRYIRLVLPLDGFVFWVRADLVNLGALLRPPYTLFQQQSAYGSVLQAKGSLHYMTDQQQTPDENYALNHVVFTAEEPIENFNTDGQSFIYIGEIDEIRFAFSKRGSFYRQSSLWHYEGDAIYPMMETQIIDSLEDLNLRDVVVSNSLPIWLGLNSIAPVYPSQLAPDNTIPPYVSINVLNTTALQASPLLDETLSHYQLVKDEVRITTYGLRNNEVMDYMDMVFRSMLDQELMGLMNMPVPTDEKLQQNELNILAQKKSMTFQVSYNQARVRDIGRQLIKSCIPTFILKPS